MRISRIFLEQPFRVGDDVQLSPEAAHYLITVLRAKVGAELVLFNGKGGEYHATLTEVGKKTATARLDAFEGINRASFLKVHLGIGMSRGERFDQVIQKATELGVTEVTPLYTERTEVKLNDSRLSRELIG